MRTKILTLISIILLAVIMVSLKLYKSDEGPHGGVIKQTNDNNYLIETKNIYSDFYVFLLDKKTKPISNIGILCDVRFTFYDGTILTIPLKPMGKDGFNSGKQTLDYLRGIVYCNVNGKIITSTFDNNNLIVKSKQP